ncbi:TraM recognition site of TraD and TraG [Amycolatopsis sacchari]|uniref:TraM recognition site of TraD and TraG n=1 Tax=Amycolatopsis sacchari TaxID=115433 RepID=A0A1I4ABB2_9PSEU|nr:type IV secretion system DNA-binding domain-containing protein [Amycolatopsis sacchari]SFK53470.1 TraM recognition site of TraD and TraG [Amycolatopsis sacchari]
MPPFDPWTAVHAILVFTASAGALTLLRFWWWRRFQAALRRNARLITVLTPPAVAPADAQAFWSNLVGLLRPRWARFLGRQPHVAMEFSFGHDGLQIRLWVPGSLPPGLVERAVEAAWPGARTTTAPATPHLSVPRHAVVVGGTLRLGRPQALPIRTDFPADPLRALLGAATGLGSDEHIYVQVLAKPVTGRRVGRAKRGQSSSLTGRILDGLTPGASPKPARDPRVRLETNAQDRAIVDKHRGNMFDTAIRYVVVATERRLARGCAHAIASAFAGFAGHNYYRRRRLRAPLKALNLRRFRGGDLLSIPELAAIAHLPLDEALPGIRRAGARAVSPPPETPTIGPSIKPLGISDVGHARPVGLRVSDSRHHVHLLGSTGSGKSTLLANLILADAEHGRGAVVIDPKGDLITDLLMRVPERAIDRVVLFDSDSPGPVPCLNPLEGPKDIAVENLVSVFARVFSATWGPRTEDILRAACLTLRAADESPALTALPGLLTNPAGSSRHRAAVRHDPVLRGFWEWYEQLSDGSRAHAIAPLLNKLRALLLRPFVVRALAAGPSTVDMRQVLDGGLCLVRIPKGNLGDDTARLIGSLVVGRVWQTVTARSATPQRERRDAALYVDEAHNFLNLPYTIDDMLAEARAYRLSMVLAHQNLAQLSRELREGVSANARTKIYFSSSPEDARELARHTAPRLTDYDLAHLEAFHAAIRLVVDGEEKPAFTAITNRMPPAVRGRAKQVRLAAARNIRTPPNPGSTAQRAPDPRRAA